MAGVLGRAANARPSATRASVRRRSAVLLLRAVSGALDHVGVKLSSLHPPFPPPQHSALRHSPCVILPTQGGCSKEVAGSAGRARKSSVRPCVLRALDGVSLENSQAQGVSRASHGLKSQSTLAPASGSQAGARGARPPPSPCSVRPGALAAWPGSRLLAGPESGS